MPIPNRNDNDEFRAMGYVSIYAAYAEENVGRCYHLLRHYDPIVEGVPWQAMRRIESCRRAIRALPSHAVLSDAACDLSYAKYLFRSRNYAIHSPLYAQAHGGNVRVVLPPGVQQRFVTANQIYDLAEDLLDVSDALFAASVMLPRALREALRK